MCIYYMRITVFIVIATFCGCGPVPVPEVDWSNYHPEVRQRINHMATEQDCRGLQDEFDIAYSNDGAQRNRTGRGNANLMDYIDGKLRKSGCY